TVVPRRGTYVTPVGLSDVLEMFEAREAIECGVAFIAARRITPPQLEQLRALVGQADQARSDVRPEDHLVDDHAIHAYLVEIASNGLLRDAAERLLQHNLRFWRSYWSSHHPQASTMLPHADLLAALEAHD
ncbi:GntR family transcriptional regulator, partial [Bradyrhizobium sp. NBAIM08]|uniref:GntR family transcriptional regulator n=1 Tax=Bradyrhizobium sp. NBAIM08 TaxID=2793815 RepID=UPI001CD5D23C